MKQCLHCNNFYTDSTQTCPNDNKPLAKFEINNLVGQTIDGKYKVEEVLGKGGMGAVFRCRHTFINNILAIKVIHPELAMDKNIVERFLREARAAATIDHPNAIRVSDFGRVGDLLYLVMEYVQGATLKAYLKKKKRLSVKETAAIMTQISAALDIAHKHRIIHRDLKPDNIMLKQGPLGELIVKVVDFGIAKVRSGGASNQAASVEATEQLTNVGTIIGTASYMSPEQCQATSVDHRSDIYSLGIMTYQAVTGHLPFTAPIPMQVIIKHISEPVPKPRTMRPDLSEEIEKVLLRALEKDPAARFTSAGEFAAALSAAAISLVEDSGQEITEFINEYLTQEAKRPPTEKQEKDLGSQLAAHNTTETNPAPEDNHDQRPAADSPYATVVAHSNLPDHQHTVVGPAGTSKLGSGTSVGSVGDLTDLRSNPRPKLLIVNDSKAILMLLKHQMQQAGYEVIAQTESISALTTILDQRPHIVIVGIEMPQMSGPELCQKLRTSPAYSAVAHVPVLLYSSLSEEELRVKVSECGASGYIHKTWNMDKVANHLAQYHLANKGA